MTRVYHNAVAAAKVIMEPAAAGDVPSPDELVRKLNADLEVARAEITRLRQKWVAAWDALPPAVRADLVNRGIA